MRRPIAVALLLLAGACHRPVTPAKAPAEYRETVQRVVAWEELEAKLFAQQPAERSDADIQAYLAGASKEPKPLAPAERASLVQTFKNSPPAIKSEKDQRTFEACQQSVQNGMEEWFEGWEAAHRGTSADCAMAKASAAAAEDCSKHSLAIREPPEERHCVCERAMVWKTVIAEAGLQALERRASAALAKGAEPRCP